MATSITDADHACSLCGRHLISCSLCLNNAEQRVVRIDRSADADAEREAAAQERSIRRAADIRQGWGIEP